MVKFSVYCDSIRGHLPSTMIKQIALSCSSGVTKSFFSPAPNRLNIFFPITRGTNFYSVIKVYNLTLGKCWFTCRQLGPFFLSPGLSLVNLMMPSM